MLKNNVYNLKVREFGTQGTFFHKCGQSRRAANKMRKK